MTREEVLELTLQVIKGKMWWATNIELILEVALAAAEHEREACAQVCLTYAQTAFNNSSNNAAMELHEAIKARGKA